MMLLAILSAVVLFFGSAVNGGIELISCENGIDIPYEVSITNCDEQPCTVVRGNALTVLIDFFAPYYIDDLSPSAVAIVLGLEVNYPLPDKDGCSALTNTRCPLEAEEYTSYNFTMEVSKIFPAISLPINFTLFDQDNKGVVCFQVACKIA